MPIFIKGTRYKEVARVKQIKFSDGKTLAMNRQERRKNKIYNRDLTPAAEPTPEKKPDDRTS